MTSYKDQHKQAQKEVQEAVNSLEEFSFNIESSATVEFVEDTSHWQSSSFEEAFSKDEALSKGKEAGRVAVTIRPYSGVNCVCLSTDTLQKIESTVWKARSTMTKIAEARRKAHALNDLALQERRAEPKEADEQQGW